MASANSKTTIDHDEIRRWAETRGGQPAAVRRTGKGGDPGIIRLAFPGHAGKDGALEQISWEAWFESFDESGLALVLQEHLADGTPSHFSKLVSRDAVDLKSGGKIAPPRRTRRATATNARQRRATASASRGKASAGRAQARREIAAKSGRAGTAKRVKTRTTQRRTSARSR
jgi:hypothetical protein